MSTQETLTRARSLVEERWCKGLVFPYTENCLVSAIVRAAGHDKSVYDSCIALVVKVNGITKPLGVWNDAKSTTKTLVLAALDAAIAAAGPVL